MAATISARRPRSRSRAATDRKPPARSRGPGRPRADGPDQRARVIDAALACYVQKGIHGTTIRDIATAAGVTPALVHYYFGDATQLLEQVIATRLMPVFEGLRESLRRVDPASPWALVEAFVHYVFAAADAHPWWPALWVREVVNEGGALRDLLFTRVAPQLTKAISDQFALAQARGRLNRDLDPRLLMVSLVGLTLFPAAGAPVWRQIFNARDLTSRHLQAHALALLARGLEVKP